MNSSNIILINLAENLLASSPNIIDLAADGLIKANEN